MDRNIRKRRRRGTSRFRMAAAMAIVVLLLVFGGRAADRGAAVLRTIRLLSWQETGDASGSLDHSRRVLAGLPVYSGEPCVVLDGNVPSFTRQQLSEKPYAVYRDLDALGRCTGAEAMLDASMMPTEPRGEIGDIRPSGWHTVKYDCIEDLFLYNRCHLIGYQFTGENANERNLITGTRYMNKDGMLPWENLVAGYLRRTGDRVLYRVTPIFDGADLVARGVEMEAASVMSEEICFHVFVYNVQPGIEIDYGSGESRLEDASGR